MLENTFFKLCGSNFTMFVLLMTSLEKIYFNITNSFKNSFCIRTVLLEYIKNNIEVKWSNIWTKLF